MKKWGIWLSLLAVLLAGLPVQTRAADTGEILIPVSVLSEGYQPDPDAIYTVELAAQTEGAPMPEGSAGDRCRLEMKNGSTVLKFRCEMLGVFDYTVRQIPGSAPECTYDDEVFRLRLFVTKTETGDMAVSAVVYGQDESKAANILFRNYWAKPVWVTLTAAKLLDGGTPEDDAFTFQLLTWGGQELRAKNQGRRVEFPELRFDAEGTYWYELKEKAGKEEGIFYDTSVYSILIHVTKDRDYHAEVEIRRNDEPYEGIPVFRNYTEGGTPQTGDTVGIPLTVTLLSGAALLILLRKRSKAR